MNPFNHLWMKVSLYQIDFQAKASQAYSSGVLYFNHSRPNLLQLFDCRLLGIHPAEKVISDVTKI